MVFTRILYSVGVGAVVASTMAQSPANAAIAEFTVSPGLGNGYGTTCSYQLKAVSANALRISFLDNGWEFRDGNKQVSGDTVTTTWTPREPGTHILTAKEVTGDLSERTVTVQVGVGTNLGSACAVQ
ncbi:MAG: hypothetical protein HOQ44_00665 [Nocardia sp.]|nr:hypothetical protein [Nocardia sp.]